MKQHHGYHTVEPCGLLDIRQRVPVLDSVLDNLYGQRQMNFIKKRLEKTMPRFLFAILRFLFTMLRFLFRKIKLIFYYLFGTAKSSTIAELFDIVKPVAIDKKLIRVGSDNDGGYLIPDDLKNIEACFSPGVADSCDFDKELADNGIKVFLCDASIDKPPHSHPLFDFRKKYLGTKTEGEFIRLDGWINMSHCGEGDLLLQMDIEGAEYDVLESTSLQVLKRFRIMVIEFHGALPIRYSKTANVTAFNSMVSSIKKLSSIFAIVHIHVNNACSYINFRGKRFYSVMEFTFYRRDSFIPQDKAIKLPHPLDRVNVPDRKDITIDACWYE